MGGRKPGPSLRELSKLIRVWDNLEKNPEEATETLEQAVDKYPDFAPAWGHLGMAYMQTARAKDAERALLRAVTLEPRTPGWHLALSTLYKIAVGNAKGLMERVERIRRLAEVGVMVPQELLMAPALREYVAKITLDALGCSYEYARVMAEGHAKEVFKLSEDRDFIQSAMDNLEDIKRADEI